PAIFRCVAADGWKLPPGRIPSCSSNSGYPSPPSGPNTCTIAAALNAPPGFETPGMIAAVDLYNHNTDRFVPPTDNRRGTGVVNPRFENTTGAEFRVTQNMGNVLIALQEGRYRPIGLDS